MLHPARITALAFALVLAGCGTAPTKYTTKERPPDVDLTSSGQSNQPTRIRPVAPVAPPPVAVTNSPVTNPPAPVPKPVAIAAPTETWVNLARWAGANNVGTVARLQSTTPPAFALNTPAGALILRVGSQAARWSGMELRLGHAPELNDGELYLHTLDVQKNLMPLLEPAALPAAPRIIVLDPGHGGHDSGTRSVIQGRWEKEYTLDVARRLKPLLETAGWEVYLTRTNDADVSLPARVEFADELKADLFVSLHFNATTSSAHAGIETYCLTPVGLASTVTREYEDSVTTKFPNNQFDAANLRLAARLHRAVLLGTGAEDRGVRRARFMAVLRGQNRPAALVECGYLSNPAEAKLINTPEHRQKLAEAIAKALP